MSKIAALNGYNKTTIIFCGLTEKSSSPGEIEKTIHERLKPLTIYRVKTKDGKLMPMDHGFPWLIKTSSVRHLFIIDNAGGIKDAYLQNLFPRGEKGTYAPGIKVIFTSTEGDAFRPFGRLKEIPIKCFSQEDSIRIVNAALTNHGRRLSESQSRSLANQLEGSECTGLYLNLLTLSLSSIRSGEALPPLPKNTLDLSDYLIRKIVSEDEEYGYGSAPIVLSALTVDRIGLNDDEILGLLLSNSSFWNRLSRSSFHTLTDKSVPPIVWARLYSRIKPFMANAYNASGSFYTLSSKELRRNLSDALRRTITGTETLYQCWEFYKDNTDNMHLASQTLYIGYETLKAYLSLYGRGEEFFRVLSVIIETSFLNLEFISKAFCIDRNDTLAIIDKVISEIMADDANNQIQKWLFTLSRIRNKLGNLSAVYSPEATLLALGVSPCRYSCKLVPNQFGHLSWHSAIVHALSTPTSLSRLSSDGKVVVLAKNHDGISSIYSYDIGRMGQQAEHLLFEINTEAKSIGISGDAKTICICGGDKTYFFVNNQEYECKCMADSVNVSSDGHTILLSDDVQINIYRDLDGILKKDTQQGGKLSYDGKWAWYFTDEKELHRTQTNPKIDNYFTFNGDTSVFGVEKKIVACSEHYCIISAFGGVRYSDKGFILQYNESTGFIKMSNFPLFIHDRGGRVWINSTEDKLLIYERANLLLYSLEPIKFIDCLEIDDIIDVTPDFSLLLSMRGQIIDFQQLLRTNKFIAYAEVGINAINYSEGREKFILSVGKNSKEEFYPQFHSIIKSDGRWIMNNHLMPKCEFVSASAISNAGDLYALCKKGDGNNIEIRKTENDQIVCETQPLPSPCTAIYFTKDDRHIVAAIGYYEDELLLGFDMPEQGHVYMFGRDGHTELDVDVDTLSSSRWLWSIGAKFIITENLTIVDTSNSSKTELIDNLERISFPWPYFREWNLFTFWQRGPISTREYEKHADRLSAPCLATTDASVLFSTPKSVSHGELTRKWCA